MHFYMTPFDEVRMLHRVFGFRSPGFWGSRKFRGFGPSRTSYLSGSASLPKTRFGGCAAPNRPAIEHRCDRNEAFARPRGYEANTKNYTINFLWLLHASSWLPAMQEEACKSHKKLIVVVLGVCFIASGPGEAPHSCHTDARLRADWALHSLQIVSSEEKPTQRDTTCEMDRAP